MPTTVKFSQFPAGGELLADDTLVGLRGGINTRFLWTGGGGNGGGVTEIIQQANAFNPGQWVYIEPNTGTYLLAQANGFPTGETIGVVIAATAIQFTLQQSGYITTAMGIFNGLTPGQVQFLSTAVAGAMQNMDAQQNGQISRPVFVADTATSGWVVPYRGQVVGGEPPPAPVPLPNPNIVTVVTDMPHGLTVGQFVIVNAPVGGLPVYVPGQANTLANSQTVGMVISVLSATAFMLQTEGYVFANAAAIPPISTVTVDYLGNPLNAATVYYLDSVVPGAITAIPPNLPGQINRPVYITEQTLNSTGVSAGYILGQRPLDMNMDNDNAYLVVQPGNNFAVSNWLYISADNTYTRAIANTLPTSQAVGVVTGVPASPPYPNGSFFLQSSGFVTGVVTVDQGNVPLASGTVYYLSDTNAGAIESIPTNIVGHATKPVYIQHDAATNTGLILNQRPLLVTAPPGPPVAGALTWIASVTANNSATIDFVNLLGPNYDNYFVTFEGLVPVGGPNSFTFVCLMGTGALPNWIPPLGVTYKSINGFNINNGFTGNNINTSAGFTLSAYNHMSNSGITNNPAPLNGNMYVYSINSNLYDTTISGHTNYFDINYAGWGQTIFSGALDQNGIPGTITSLRFSFLQTLTPVNMLAGTIKLYGLQN